MMREEAAKHWPQARIEIELSCMGRANLDAFKALAGYRHHARRGSAAGQRQGQAVGGTRKAGQRSNRQTLSVD